MTNYRLPWECHPQLSEERLTIIAEELLKVLDNTHEQLSSPLDDNYTRGTCTFGRQRNRLIHLCSDDTYDWLHLANPGMDVTFTIDGIPVRFFSDDPADPKKPGFFRRNEVDQLWKPEVTIPTVHRFVVEKPEFEGEGARVHFIGFNALDEMVSKWTYGESRVTVLHSTDDALPTSVPIELDPISALMPDKDKKSHNE
ncbi:hypothetical protein [Xenorhabdus bovienii]|uniref:hypothetical protein n=1 Tax=Xenorhabdus bovienii TaxID=40576 RepID=UPI0023B2CABE|nr:hypothetical protein [Xenorhabdus bovienii]MDE9460910.1 hypothetical protein [Xenorhabdus bovienii]MDE9468353.1 hypothetical protein [Xenorhabdus bovienii]